MIRPLILVLVLLTARKAFDLARHERRQKRGGGTVLDEAALPCAAGSSGRHARRAGRGSTPRTTSSA